jgi:hypothetical protein
VDPIGVGCRSGAGHGLSSFASKLR